MKAQLTGLVAALALGALSACDESQTTPQQDVDTHQGLPGSEKTSPPRCEGGDPVLSITSHGGMQSTPLDQALFPYGGAAWFIDGRCAVRHLNAQRVFQGAALNPAQLETVRSLSVLPVFAKYDGQVYGMPGCEGVVETIHAKTGSVRCHCSCTISAKELPHDLARAIAQVQALAQETQSTTQPLQMDVGVVAMDARHPQWTPLFSGIPEERWQVLELPLHTPTLASLQMKHPVRVTDPAIKTQLRSRLAQHRAWLDSTNAGSQSIHPNLMYLRDAAGARVVIGVVELAEPGLVPNL